MQKRLQQQQEELTEQQEHLSLRKEELKQHLEDKEAELEEVKRVYRQGPNYNLITETRMMMQKCVNFQLLQILMSLCLCF